MKNHKQLLAVLVCVAVFCAAGAAYAQPSYTEDFTTTAYKDAVNTTADWNTVDAELKLFSFPMFLGSYDTPHQAWDVAVSGYHAFVADFNSGLWVIDISDPTTPTSMGSYNTLGQARDVVISGDHAFVADGGYGLQVIDVSDPTTPTVVGSYLIGDNALGITVSGDHAFLASDNGGLKVMDISDPTAPTLAGSYNTPDHSYAVAVAGDYAFVADGGSGLQVIDISDPTTPTSGWALDIVTSGDYAFMAGGASGLQVFDISDPSTPTLAATWNSPIDAWGVAVLGDRAFLADEAGGLQVIDVSDPTNPIFKGSYDTPGLAYGVAIAGNHAFVADISAGLQVISISETMNPMITGSYTTSDAWDVAVSGDHAFLADEGGGLRVIDISDPTTPTLEASYNTAGSAYDVAISGDHVFVAETNQGIRVIDISSPASPTSVGFYSTTGNNWGVTVSGNHAYLAKGGNGLQVIDVSDPTSPTLAGSYNTTGDSRAVAVSGDHAFVADGGSGIQVIDISDPTTPTLDGNYDTPGWALDIVISGDHAFMAGGANGLQVIAISDPTTPTLAGSWDSPIDAWGVAVSGDRAYLADDDSGLQVIDISDPTNPTPVGSYNTTGNAYGVAVSGHHAFVADRASGLQVIRVAQDDGVVANDRGQSLAVDAADDAVIRARLTVVQTSNVSWELSADAGANWLAKSPPYDSWTRFTVPGNDLLWRTTHMWSLGVNPTVSNLTLEWLNEFGPITSIADVPDDQGGRVDVTISRSGYDFEDETLHPVTGYNIYRRVDAPSPVATSLDAMPVIDDQVLLAPSGRAAWPLPGENVVTTGDEVYVLGSASRASAASFPPGAWKLVSTVFATQSDNYLVEATTDADSATAGIDWSVYLVTTHTTTPSVWFVSPPDSGYSVDNIAPAVPLAFFVAYNTGSGNTLTWDPVPDNDLQYYKVYRGTTDDFSPAPGNLIDATTSTSWSDTEYDGWQVYYKVTAVDFAGNEGGPTGSDPASGAGDDPVIPDRFALRQNVPNPFNPTTVIGYDVPAGGGHVTLRIYDVAGRLVRTLVDGTQSAGVKNVMWQGENDRGARVATGVYFYRLTAPGFEQTRKMVLVQ
jgi:hypothetical protein